MYFLKTFFQYLQDNFFSSSLNGNYEYLEITETTTTLLMIIGGLCLGMILAAFAIFFQKKVIGRFVRALLYAQAYDKESAKSLEELGFSGDAIIKQEISHASVTRKLLGIVEEDTVYLYEEELAASFPDYAEREAQKRERSLSARVKRLFRRKPTASADAETAETASAAPIETETAASAAATATPDGNKKWQLHRPNFDKAKFFIPEHMKYRAQNRFSEKGTSALWLVLFVVATVILFFLALRFLPMFVNMIDVSIGNLLGK